MHLRKLVLACGFASLALSNYASALGLGEVKLKSTLNQPLSAEVQLLDTKGLTAEQIIVGLASSSEFERNGLDFVHFYSEMKFEVAMDSPGGPVVRISSRNPVREPYLNFLIEAKWSSGRLLREYTLLMDLPTFDAAAPSAVQAPKAVPAKPSTSTNQPRRAETAPVTQAPAEPPSPAIVPEEKPEIIAEQDQQAKTPTTSSGTYGPVGEQDTLWEIALAVRPDSSASVHQTMLALQRLNPDAFIRGNINLLKKGQVLRVPDANEIASVSQSEAVRQFNNQVSELSGNPANQGNTSLGAQLDATSRTSTERAKSEAVTGRVKLEAPGTKDKAAGGQGGGSNKGAGRALESELASTLEELDRARSEKTELSSRVHDLEEQVKTMQRLVDVSNEKLRALQLNAGKQPDKTVVDGGVSQTAAPESKNDTAGVESSAAVASSAAQTSSNAAVASAAAKPVTPIAKKPPVKSAPKAVESEKTLTDHISDNILWIGIGAAALLLIAALVVIRRRKEQEDAEQARALADEQYTEPTNFDAFNQASETDPTLESVNEEAALLDEENTSAVAETGDVVGEADIYIAYGKYDQAEEMLINGLTKDPASTDIRLKLLEVYSQTHNASAFDKHYAALLPIAAGFALTRAKELRSGIPGIGEFNPDAVHSQIYEQHEQVQDENHDLLSNELEAEPTSLAAATEDDEFKFDLDLDEDLLTEQEESTTNYGMDFNDKTDLDATTTASLDDDFTLDFDLDDEPKQSEAEDLSEISLALDGLDEDDLSTDIQVSKLDEDFSFDFDDLDSELDKQSSESVAADNNTPSSQFGQTLSDDFNLEMDVNDVDLAALDDEMASLDAELESLDGVSEDDVNDEFASLDDELAALDDDEFTLDSIEKSSDTKDELAALDTDLELEDFDVSEDEFDENSIELDHAAASLLDGDIDEEAESALGVKHEPTDIEGSGSDTFVADNSTKLDDDEFSWEDDELGSTSTESEASTSKFGADDKDALDDVNKQDLRENEAADVDVPDIDGIRDGDINSAEREKGLSQDDLDDDGIDESSSDKNSLNEHRFSETRFDANEFDKDQFDGELDLDDDVRLQELDENFAGSDDIELDDELVIEESTLADDDLTDLDLSETDFDDDNLFAETEADAENINNEFDADDALFTEEELSRLDNIDEEAVEEVIQTNSAQSVEDDLSDDDLFEQALSDFSAEGLAADDAATLSEEDMDAELDFMADADEAATKLDLARAYMDMGDSEGARDILAEVASEGNDEQRQEATDLLSRIDA